jgi:competence protein ComEC
MPRSGWLAMGAVSAAILYAATGDAWVAAICAGAVLGAAVLWAGGTRPLHVHATRASGQPRLLLVGVGATLVAVRLVILAVMAASTPSLPTGSGPFVADVVSLGSPGGGSQRAVLAFVVPSGLRVYGLLPGYPEVIPGDRVVVKGRVRPPPVDGFGEYLRRNGIAGSITSSGVERLPPAPGLAAWLEVRRRTARELIASVLPEPEAGLASGILIGLRDAVDRDVAAAFTAAGVSHIVAISGWNISIVAAAIAAALRRAGRRTRSAVVLAGIVAYVLAAGASPSVVRAAIMAAVLIFSRAAGRRSRASGALGVAAFAMVVIDPAVASDPGFQLSAAATAGLLAWGTGVSEWLRSRFPKLVPDSVVEALGVSLAAQVATFAIVLVQFGRLSLVAPVANLASAPLVTPVMIAAAIALLAGWAVSLGAPHALASVVGAFASVVLGSLIAVARMFAALPFASLDVSGAAAWGCAAASVGVTWILVDDDRRGGIARRFRRRAARARDLLAPARRAVARLSVGRRRDEDPFGAVAARVVPRSPGGARPRVPWTALIVAGVVAFPALGAVASGPPLMALTMLDVGQGDAILVESPHGERLLVDGGPDPVQLLAALDRRVPAWDRRVDVVVVTHPHADHVAGMPVLLRRYVVATLVRAAGENAGAASAPPGADGAASMLPGADGAAEAALDAAAIDSGVEQRTVSAGDRIPLDGVGVRVWWPEPQFAGSNATAADGANDRSIVLDVTFGDRRFLLTGDAGEAVDAALLARGIAGTDERRVDVLKVAHHGSATSSTAALLEAIRPRIALISVGADNTYGHPAAAALDRLSSVGARTWRTDRDGSVTVSTDGRSLDVDSERGEDSRDTSNVALPQRSTRNTSRAPRIAAWVSRLEPPLQPSCCRSTRRRGSLRTPRSWPRLPHSSRSGRRRKVRRSTVPLSRPPPSSTTSTSCSRRIIHSRSWVTARRARAG